MGILRTDRVSGLGGANAITGSAFFAGGKATTTSSDYALGTDDFTVEFFVYFSGKHATLSNIIETRSATTASDGFLIGRFQTSGHENKIEMYTAQDYRVTADRTVENDTWVHIALVRASATTKLYVDGTAYSTTYSDSNNYSNTEMIFGKNVADTYQLTGFISNFHVVKGTAIYTANFTPPTNQIQKRSDTVFLGFQSASDVTREETGKIITFPISGHNSVSHGPDTSKSVISSKFTPNSPVGFSTTTDVGTQFGSTFDGVTTFDSQAYIVPPAGNTRERNRGRALWAGGDNPGGPNSNVIDFIQIQSGGIGLDFGDLTAAGNQVRGVSSFTRGVFGGGRRPHPSPVNTMDFVTIANTANAQDFGDLTDNKAAVGEISSSTRGIFAAGFNPSNVNTIDFITIATLGNASDFGDTTIAANAMAGTQSTTRGILGGGYPSYNVIQFLTIATTGNAQDFGDLTDSRHSASGTSNGVRAVFMGGDHASPAADNTIDFITIATTGNATDFGDLGSISIGTGGATSDKIRGVFGTGYNGSNYLNVIQQVTIATTGNSVDIGELTLLRHQPACLGDAHGGLSE